MTEEEAKTKWCPMVRMKPSGLVADLRHLPDTLCLGTACMMWRGTYTVEDGRHKYLNDGEGYCGLAGGP